MLFWLCPLLSCLLNPLTCCIFSPGSVFFLLISLTALATILYLPHHIMFLVGRAWFYIHGDSALEVARETARTFVQTTKTAAATWGTQTATRAVAQVAGEVAKAEL